MKKLICAIIALALTIAAVAVLYTDTMYKLFPKQNIATVITGTLANNGDELGFDYFPLYTGIYNLCAKYVAGINSGDVESLNTAGEDAMAITKEESFISSLYAFIIIALVSLPVYMLVRLVPFNTLYEHSGSCFLFARPFYRGITCLCCSVVTVTATWLLYHSAFYTLVKTKIVSNLSSVDITGFSFNATNIVIIAVIAVALFAIIKHTLFRGSILKSVLTALLRTLLYTLMFALVNAFTEKGGVTGYTLLFGLIFIFTVGVLDLIFDPSKKKA